MTLSNANASALEVVAWRIEDLILPQTTFTTDKAYAHHRAVYRYEGEVTATVEPLVTAASAQARIAELERDKEELARTANEWTTEAHERLQKVEAAEARADRYYNALVQADLTIRAFPGTDQSDVEFIRAALQQETQP